MENNFINQIYYGDNLDVMTEKIPNNSIDLIYLDPPFNSNRNYNRIYSQHIGQPVPEEAIAFCDAWELTSEKLDQVDMFADELRKYDGNEYFAVFYDTFI